MWSIDRRQYRTYSIVIFCLPGEVGGVYPSKVQAQLPRLLLSAAPPGSNGRENRRQCLKVYA